MILHCDLDAFYASVEQVTRPELAGKPVIVGGDPRKRGVVAAASYEARTFGVHSAMPVARAARLCPSGIFVSPRFDLYRDFSSRVFAIYHAYAPVVEPLSLDEAFLDLAGTERAQGQAREVALRIRDEVKEATRLNVSIGIGTCKVVAKIASDLKKPCGLVEVPLGAERTFLASLPLRRLPGLGPSTEERLERFALKTIGDLAALPRERLAGLLGKHGEQLWEMAQGIDPRPVLPPGDPKSISRETTFDEDTGDPVHLEATLRHLAEHAARTMRDHGLRCRTIALKLRYENFETITRSHSLPAPTQVDASIVGVALDLFHRAYEPRRKIRLIGVGVSAFSKTAGSAPIQPSLFDAPAPDAREARLTASMDRIRDRHGWSAISRGPAIDLEQRDWRREDLDQLGAPGQG